MRPAMTLQPDVFPKIIAVVYRHAERGRSKLLSSERFPQPLPLREEGGFGCAGVHNPFGKLRLARGVPRLPHRRRFTVC